MELKGLGAELWKADALPNLEGGATLEDFPKPDTTKTPKPGCMRGRIWMADATPNLEGDALMMLVEDTEQIKKTKKPLQLGCMEGEIWMADDFDAPLEDFKEYIVVQNYTMKYLLDTHTALWALGDKKKLSEVAACTIIDPAKKIR